MLTDPETVLGEQLFPGERLIWSGRPVDGLRLRAADWCLIPFSIFWTVFSLIWMGGAYFTGASILFRLFGVPFVLIGLFLLFGRFFTDAHTRSRTCYGITNERILILGGLFNRQIKSLLLQSLTDVTLNERKDGIGTITFGPTWILANQGESASPRTLPSFDLIPNAREVFRTIQEAQKAARVVAD